MKYYSPFLLALCLSACAKAPPVTDVSNFVDGQYAEIPEEAAAGVSRWWSELKDPELDTLLDQMVINNLQLKIMAERLVQAHGALRMAGGARYPTLAVTAEGSRSFISADGLGSALLPGDTRIFSNSYQLGLSSSWQIDLFGKLSHAVKASDANWQALQEDALALKQMMTADIVNLKISLSTLKKRLQYARKMVASAVDQAEFIEQRYRAGLVSQEAVLGIQNQRAAAQMRLEALHHQHDATRYRLELLLGQSPSKAHKLHHRHLPMPKQAVYRHAGIPAHLIDNRPDLRASRHRITALSEQAKVAVADQYPSLSLGGNIGFKGSGSNGLFMADRLTGSFLSKVMMQLFQGGQIQANIDIKASEAKVQGHQYVQDVLNAMREVETAISEEKSQFEQLGHAQRNEQRAKMLYQNSERGFKAGTQSSLDLLSSQSTWLEAKDQLQQQLLSYWQSRIHLYSALGGQWWAGV